MALRVFSLHPIAKSILSAGIVILFSFLLSIFRPALTISVIALLYLVPVVFSAALLDRIAGITASVLSFLILNFFFISPFYTFRVAHLQDFLALIVFLGVAILISSLMARIQSNLAQVRSREREAVQLYELSLELAGKKDQQMIAETLAQRLSALFKNAVVEVETHQPSNIVRKEGLGISHNAAPERGQTIMNIPLATPGGSLGEIRMWFVKGDIMPEEERLLRTFASQGALALDRAILADSETRARVLEESDRLKTAILSSVSHELRTPLATIQAAATSLYNPNLSLEPAARNELQTLLLEETDNMALLVGNLLNMSRIEAGALKLQRQWNSMAEIVDTSLRRLSRNREDQRVVVDVSEDLPLVSIDSVLMEQVVINLVRNSLKFAPPGTLVRISATAEEQALLVTVSNVGPPIPEEYLQYVFEKFYPIPGKDISQGTGLGLSICKGIVEAHGGRIWASNLAPGVAFHFLLPGTWQGSLPVTPDQETEGR